MSSSSSSQTTNSPPSPQVEQEVLERPPATSTVSSSSPPSSPLGEEVDPERPPTPTAEDVVPSSPDHSAAATSSAAAMPSPPPKDVVINISDDIVGEAVHRRSNSTEQEQEMEHGHVVSSRRAAEADPVIHQAVSMDQQERGPTAGQSEIIKEPVSPVSMDQPEGGPTAGQSEVKQPVCIPPTVEQPIITGLSHQTEGGQTVSGVYQPTGNGSQSDEDDPFLEADEDLLMTKTNKFSILWCLQLLGLLLIGGALACTLTVDALRKRMSLEVELWKLELIVLVAVCGRLGSGWLIQILFFIVENKCLLRKRFIYFVFGLRNEVKNVLWLTMVMVVWLCIMDEKIKRLKTSNFRYVTDILICFAVGSLVWLLKTVFVKVLASSFHVSSFFDRIEESLFNEYVIKATMSHKRGGRMYRLITIDHLHKLNPKNISAWFMKRMVINTARKDTLSTLDENIRGSTGKDETMVQFTSENQAKVAAKKIFFNVAKPGSKYIYLEDLARFMREDEARKTIGLFEDGSEHNRISKHSLQNWVVNAFKERRALALSLNDSKTAIDKLHQMLNVIVGSFIVGICLYVLGVLTKHLLIFLGSQLLLVVFMYGNQTKVTFEAIIFLFVMHPFDVGDRVEIDGVQMVVEEMKLLTTEFLKYDSTKISYPNSVLATKPISNYHRSPDMGDSIDFGIHISTREEKIATMKERITSYIESQSDHWSPEPMIVLRDMVDMNNLKFSVWVTHKMNFQDMGERWTRRGLLVAEIVKILRELDIELGMLPVDVSLRNMPLKSSARVPSTWAVSSA